MLVKTQFLLVGMLLSLQMIEQIFSGFLNVIHFWEDNKDEEFLKGYAGGSLESTECVHISNQKEFILILNLLFYVLLFLQLPMRQHRLAKWREFQVEAINSHNPLWWIILYVSCSKAVALHYPIKH